MRVSKEVYIKLNPKETKSYTVNGGALNELHIFVPKRIINCNIKAHRERKKRHYFQIIKFNNKQPNNNLYYDS